MPVAVGVKFIDLVKAFRYLVITFHSFWPHGSALHTNLVGLKKFIRLLKIILYPYFQLLVVFKRTDKNRFWRPCHFLCFKLFLQAIFQFFKYRSNFYRRTLPCKGSLAITITNGCKGEE